MATNKHAIIRYQALDNCFRNTGRNYSINDLVEACNTAIYNYDESDGVRKRSVYDDITFMESSQGWSIELEKRKSGRTVYYSYSDPSFSIKNEPLNESEANQLKEALLTLNRFKGLPQFGWVDEMITRLDSSFNLTSQDQEVIEFDQNPYLKGLEHITTLYHSIVYKEKLNVNYQSFKSDKPSDITFHPHFLKQYNNRWFVFGLDEKYNSITNLALDRIIGFEKIKGDYISSKIDFNEYFEDIIGVSLEPDENPILVTIKVTKEQWPYIESKPIHGSQKTISVSEEGEAMMSIEIIPNIEFEKQMLSYGEDIEIISPTEVRNIIKLRAQALLSKYT
jgi:predicted DNA-binding transcriptional regulator YafY